MRMSDNQKENWRYLFGAIGAIAMLLISVWLKDYVETQKETRAKIDAIFINSVTSQLKDSLQNININRIDQHQKETDQKILQMMESILQSQIQISSIRDPQYLKQGNQNYSN